MTIITITARPENIPELTNDIFITWNEIFNCFLNTAIFHEKQYSLDDILREATLASRFYKYNIGSDYYLAKVAIKQYIDADWINIELACGVFPSKPQYCKYDINEGIAIFSKEQCQNMLENSPSIKETFGENYNKIKCKYDYKNYRIDMKFYPKDEKNTPRVLLTLAYHNKYIDDEIEPFEF